jgi:hypothetical protein
MIYLELALVATAVFYPFIYIFRNRSLGNKPSGPR